MPWIHEGLSAYMTWFQKMLPTYVSFFNIHPVPNPVSKDKKNVQSIFLSSIFHPSVMRASLPTSGLPIPRQSSRSKGAFETKQAAVKAVSVSRRIDTKTT